MSTPTEFLPGDRVSVIAGTFVGMQGVVLSLAEAQALWQTAGGQQLPVTTSPEMIFVSLNLFSRLVPVCFERFQVEHSDDC